MFNKLKIDEKRVALDANKSTTQTYRVLAGKGVELIEGIVNDSNKGDIDTASSESGFSKQMIAAAIYWNNVNPSGAINEHTLREWDGLNYMVDPSRSNLDKLAFPGFVYPQI
jgi:hypothetical protein